MPTTVQDLFDPALTPFGKTIKGGKREIGRDAPCPPTNSLPRRKLSSIQAGSSR